jgi:hypothetical protein
MATAFAVMNLSHGSAHAVDVTSFAGTTPFINQLEPIGVPADMITQELRDSLVIDGRGGAFAFADHQQEVGSFLQTDRDFISFENVGDVSWLIDLSVDFAASVNIDHHLLSDGSFGAAYGRARVSTVKTDVPSLSGELFVELAANPPHPPYFDVHRADSKTVEGRFVLAPGESAEFVYKAEALSVVVPLPATGWLLLGALALLLPAARARISGIVPL